MKAEPEWMRTFLVITHYLRILCYLPLDVVHVLVDGRVVESGGPELARQLEESDYETQRPAGPPAAALKGRL